MWIRNKTPLILIVFVITKIVFTLVQTDVYSINNKGRISRKETSLESGHTCWPHERLNSFATDVNPFLFSVNRLIYSFVLIHEYSIEFKYCILVSTHVSISVIEYQSCVDHSIKELSSFWSSHKFLTLFYLKENLFSKMGRLSVLSTLFLVLLATASVINADGSQSHYCKFLYLLIF